MFFEKLNIIYNLSIIVLCMRFLILFLCLICGILVAGCAQHQVAPSSGTQDIQKGSVSPVQTLESFPAPPEENMVTAQINDKEQYDKSIPVFFSGGKGQKMVKSSWAMIRRSDGTVERFDLPHDSQKGIVITGTDGEDLVRVYAEYYDGKIYQIAEKSLRLRQRI
jgi:hypothetical protein